jgi:hypothetical protein
VFLGDVIVIALTFQQHLLNLRNVLQRHREGRLKLNPVKCQLYQKEVHYLRHIVSPKGTTTDHEKLKSVREWPTPKNKIKIRSFLGLGAYFRRSISCFANIAKPLTKLMEEKQAFQWTSEAEAVFRTPNEVLCAASIRSCPQPGERRIVSTYASNVGIGGVLSQIQNGRASTSPPQ